MKHFTRTENGTTQHLSAEDAMMEIKSATLDRATSRAHVRVISSTGRGYYIEYKDDRKVEFVRVNGAVPGAAEPVTLTTPKLRKAVAEGRKVTPLKAWAKDEPELTYAPRKPRDVCPWVAPDGRRYRVMQLRVI